MRGISPLSSPPSSSPPSCFSRRLSLVHHGLLVRLQQLWLPLSEVAVAILYLLPLSVTNARELLPLRQVDVYVQGRQLSLEGLELRLPYGGLSLALLDLILQRVGQRLEFVLELGLLLQLSF